MYEAVHCKRVHFAKAVGRGGGMELPNLMKLLVSKETVAAVFSFFGSSPKCHLLASFLKFVHLKIHYLHRLPQVNSGSSGPGSLYDVSGQGA